MTEPRKPRQRPFRPRRAPRPITHRLGSSAFPGYEILEEFEGAPGYLLWRGFANAELWANRIGNGRIFSGDSTEEDLLDQEEAQQLEAVRQELAYLIRLAQLKIIESRTVGANCSKVALWSEEQSRLGTAVEYAQVASLADPEQPMHAVHTARLLKMRAEWARAWSWFDHAIFLARTTEDWHAYAYAYSSLGSMYLERGKLQPARRALRRSLRMARRHQLNERAAVAYHNLFAVEAVAGDWNRAEEYVIQALRHYSSGSRNRPRLARDVAYRWILRGHFNLALPLSLEVLEHFSAPAERALVWSDVARSAAGVGELEVFERAWAESWLATQAVDLDPFTINILLNLAHGAAMRGDLNRARLTGTRALELARQRREGQSILEAEAVLDSLRSEGAAVRISPDSASAAADVVESFLVTLRRERAPVG